jgi:hypothetical protein
MLVPGGSIGLCVAETGARDRFGHRTAAPWLMARRIEGAVAEESAVTHALPSVSVYASADR